jgi:hypothetical protein
VRFNFTRDRLVIETRTGSTGQTWTTVHRCEYDVKLQVRWRELLLTATAKDGENRHPPQLAPRDNVGYRHGFLRGDTLMLHVSARRCKNLLCFTPQVGYDDPVAIYLRRQPPAP